MRFKIVHRLYLSIQVPMCIPIHLHKGAMAAYSLKHYLWGIGCNSVWGPQGRRGYLCFLSASVCLSLTRVNLLLFIIKTKRVISKAYLKTT